MNAHDPLDPSYDSVLSTVERLTLVVYCQVSRGGKTAFCAMTDLMSYTGASNKTLVDAKAHLEELGVLVPEGKTKHGVVIYRFDLGKIPIGKKESGLRGQRRPQPVDEPVDISPNTSFAGTSKSGDNGVTTHPPVK